MGDRRDVHVSRLLSLVLRHRPDRLGLALDDQGYVDVQLLLESLARHSEPVTREDLERIVRENDKQRFAFDAERRRIRASQGHSAAVNLEYAPVTPPTTLYHGTVARFVDAIRREGLQSRARQFVHLSREVDTATTVGRRRGEPIVLIVRAGEMASEGFEFHVSANGVWLTRHVPPRFITFP
ncbi:MAG: RNA 2'-phosphotransferase [Polyangia bacterium]